MKWYAEGFCSDLNESPRFWTEEDHILSLPGADPDEDALKSRGFWPNDPDPLREAFEEEA